MKSYENPLLGHARMRALYRALVETRLLSERLGPGGVPRGLEACWAGVAIDLRVGDLASDAQGGALLEHIRRIGQRTGSGKPRTADLRQGLSAPRAGFEGDAFARLLCAVGAAMAVQASASGGVILAYAGRSELDKAAWRRVLRIAAKGDLPLVLVALPGEGMPSSKSAAVRTVNLERLVAELELAYRIPVIQTEAADAVALYRVAQESFLRARAEGGTTIIDCASTSIDPIALMAEQLIQKRIATAHWTEGVWTATESSLQGLADKAGSPPMPGLRRLGRVH